MIVIVELSDELIECPIWAIDVLIIFLIFIDIRRAWFFGGWLIVGDVLVVVAVDAVFAVLVRKDVPS